MPYVKYTGPYDEVEVPSLRLIVKRNETVEVPTSALDGLIEQEENWKKTTATKSAQTADPVPPEEAIS